MMDVVEALRKGKPNAELMRRAAQEIEDLHGKLAELAAVVEVECHKLAAGLEHMTRNLENFLHEHEAVKTERNELLALLAADAMRRP